MNATEVVRKAIWCGWHYHTSESKTGNFCLAHLAEAYVPDCPYTTAEEVNSDADYQCQYEPLRFEYD